MGRKRAESARFEAYGGDYLKSRAGRSGPRPLTFSQSMHFTMRSSKARGAWSFRNPKNYGRVHEILRRFADKHGVKLLKTAVHLNHLHLHLKFPSTRNYRRFIRAVTAAIAMAITGMSRWSRLKVKFWDRRPFSRPVYGERARLRVDDYLEINQLEAIGYSRALARFRLDVEKAWADRKRIRFEPFTSLPRRIS